MALSNWVNPGPLPWPGAELEVQPGDLSQWAPQGIGLAVPMVVLPWGGGPAPSWYGLQGRSGHPFHDAPINQAAGGVVYFDADADDADLDGLFRVLDVHGGAEAYAAYFAEAEAPGEEGYVTQLRLVTDFALKYLYRVPNDAEFARATRQPRPLGAALYGFLEHERERWGVGMDEGLSGVLGGDGDWAREALCFGFAVENTYQGIYRIWSRAWLVTK